MTTKEYHDRIKKVHSFSKCGLKADADRLLAETLRLSEEGFEDMKKEAKNDKKSDIIPISLPPKGNKKNKHDGVYVTQSPPQSANKKSLGQLWEEDLKAENAKAEEKARPKERDWFSQEEDINTASNSAPQALPPPIAPAPAPVMTAVPTQPEWVNERRTMETKWASHYGDVPASKDWRGIIASKQKKRKVGGALGRLVEDKDNDVTYNNSLNYLNALQMNEQLPPDLEDLLATIIEDNQRMRHELADLKAKPKHILKDIKPLDMDDEEIEAPQPLPEVTEPLPAPNPDPVPRINATMHVGRAIVDSRALTNLELGPTRADESQEIFTMPDGRKMNVTRHKNRTTYSECVRENTTSSPKGIINFAKKFDENMVGQYSNITGEIIEQKLDEAAEKRKSSAEFRDEKVDGVDYDSNICFSDYPDYDTYYDENRGDDNAPH